MPNTLELISSSIVGSGGTAAIDFTSIPSTYTDLLISISARCDAGGTDRQTQLLKFNTSTANFSNKVLQGTGSGVSSYGNTNAYAGVINASTSTASTFSNIQIYITNYAGSTNKSYSVESVFETNATAAIAELQAVVWSNTSAINAIQIYPNSGNYVQHTSIYLYGVKNA
jgi:hypothetical protein